MVNNLNELSAVYKQNIAEAEMQGPAEQQQRVTQIVKAVRYRARKEGVELAKAYNDYIGSVQATSTERQAVKEKLGLTGGAAHKEEVEYVEESGVGYEAGKPAEKLGAVTGISKSEQEAARERIKAKMAAKKAAKKVAESSYDPMEDPDFDHDEAEENRGVSGKNNPKGGKALGKKKKVVNKEEVSNWREEFIFEVDEPETDTENEKQIKEKKVKNKVVINPPMKEAFDAIGGTILEITEVHRPPHGWKSYGGYEKEPAKVDATADRIDAIRRSINTNKKKKEKVEEEMGSAANTQMQNVQRRQLQLDRKKLEIRKKLMSQKQTSAADSTVASEEVEHINEMPYQVMGSPTGGKEKKIGKPVKSKKYADARASELADTHKKTGGQYRSQYVEDVEQVEEGIKSALAGAGLAAAVAAGGVGKAPKPAPQSQSSSAQVQSSKPSAKEIWAKKHPGLAAKEASTKKPSSVKSQLSDIRDMISRSKERQQQNNSFEPEGNLVDEKLNLKKADMGDVVKDFYKSDAPQFKGKTKKERQKMAIAAKLSAERGEN